jgi:hypothetical protein
MAGGSNGMLKILGLALIVAGAGLAFWGYQMSGEFGSQFTQTMSGDMSDGVMMRYAGGAASAVIGLILVLKS